MEATWHDLRLAPGKAAYAVVKAPTSWLGSTSTSDSAHTRRRRRTFATPVRWSRD